ncbi:nuclear receptor subfamily 5 group A member 2-like [Acipenser ruthenus]|uniref:nuclear receptor subfamily 5 group A member 2-like n=1 Tax=Acipenser ruthenus TaxID=7906 RepID=UPI00274108EA|nr:nuclear receptor subfamily 5 group A member 2-like [Acipenser ruthenus]
MSLFSPDPSAQAALSSVDYAQDLLGSDVSGASLQVKTEDSWEDSFRETCPICGDKVSGYHYGLLTCESCKGFFKRTVQNDKRYTCLEKQSCPIDKTQRTRCPSCRFHKCLSVGMRLEAVRADRTRGGRNKLGPLYRRDRQLKQQRRGLDSSPAGISVYGIKLEYSFQPQGGTPPTPSPSPCSYEDSQSTGLGFSSPLESPLPGCLPELCDPYCQEVKSEWLCSSQVRPPLPSPSLLSEMMHCELEEAALRARVLGHLQRELASRGKHDRLNTLGIMCRVADQTLFALVEWVRGCVFFKQLTVEDQMKLMQNCWGELLVMDHLYRQVALGREGSVHLVTGQQIEVSTIVSQAGDALTSLLSRSQELVSKLRTLQLDRQEFVCLKYLVLFNPDVKGLAGYSAVERVQEQVNRSLMSYTAQEHPQHPDKFGQLLLKLPEIRSIGLQAEEYLYTRHLQGDLPCNNLLTEMLHAKQP